MTKLKQTPLHAKHVSAGAKMVPFAGYEMPVTYDGIIQEHEAVRERVGLFDVSHMGEFLVTGDDTWSWLNTVVTNNVAKLKDGGVQYTVMCRDNGTVVDDLLISRIDERHALVVVNAANIDKDFAHMKKQLKGDVSLENASEQYALLAVQGPRSRDTLLDCATFAGVADQLRAIPYYNLFRFDSGGDDIIVSRTGYTGELGFEVFTPVGRAAALWSEMLAAGKGYGISPVGLAARDTLRFEAAFCLYGHELDDDTTPLEAGLSWVVRLKKPNGFCGRDALVAERERGSRKKLIGLELEGRNIARQDYAVTHGENAVGRVTSGTFSPTLKKSLCMAFVDARSASGDAFAIEVRGRHVPARRVDLPFYPSRAKEG